MRGFFVLFTTTWFALAAAAVAQPAPQTHIRGTIQSVTDHSLAIATREGQTVDVALKEPLNVSTMKRLDLSAIQAGTYIGAAAKPDANGELVAMEVLVFPESARGAGEGHYGWDLAPGSTMTNANIAAMVEGTSGRELTLTYKGGSTKVLVPADVPIVGLMRGDQADLKPGAHVFFTPIRAADGKLSVARIIVGKDGVAPPM